MDTVAVWASPIVVLLIVAEGQPHSLTISGGIALGAYEAGVNWSIVQYIKRTKESNLGAITGASAGAINALLSAIDWCTEATSSVDENVIGETWIDVGIDELLPTGDRGRRKEAYREGDLLFSRHAFDDVEGKVRKRVAGNGFREKCDVDLGVILTRTIPAQRSVAGVSASSQRFVVPLHLHTTEDHRLIIRPRASAPLSEEVGNVIYLADHGLDPDVVGIEAVIDLLHAASAFPIAFGTIELEYCAPSCPDGDENGLVTVINRCSALPTEYDAPLAACRSVFLDGGVFDNVPIGVAMELAEPSQRKLPAPQMTYLYIDPDNRRTQPERATSEAARPKQGLIDELAAYIGDAVNTARQYELYTVLRYNHWNDGERRIVLSQRFPPLVGELLTDFGAFFDKPFRRYDYYAGVYDSVHDIAADLCEASLPAMGPADRAFEECIGRRMESVAKTLELSGDASWFLRAFSTLELGALFGETEAKALIDGPAWSWIQKSGPDQLSFGGAAILEAFKSARIPCGGAGDPSRSCFDPTLKFDRFIGLLSNVGYVPISGWAHNLIQRPGSAYEPILFAAIARLSETQKQSNEALARASPPAEGEVEIGERFWRGLEIGSLVSRTLVPDEGLQPDPSTVPDGWQASNPVFWHALPQAIGAGLAPTGVAARWEPSIRTGSFSVRAGIVPAQLRYDPVEVRSWVVAEAAYDPPWLVTDRFFSLALGPGAFANWAKPWSSRFTAGAEGGVGILWDKVRVNVDIEDFTAVGMGGAWSLSLWLNDLPGLLYWLTP